MLHNSLSQSGAWGAITTVNGSSTRSGFRDKSGFSHQMLSPFRHLRPAGFLGDSLSWREEWMMHWFAKRSRHNWQPQRWYLRIKSGHALLKSDKPTRAAKAFTLKCLVFISLRRLLLRHKKQPLSVVSAGMALSKGRRPVFEAVDVEGWRLKGSFHFFALRAKRRKRWGRCGSLRAQLQQRFPSGAEVECNAHTSEKC